MIRSSAFTIAVTSHSAAILRVMMLLKYFLPSPRIKYAPMKALLIDEIDKLSAKIDTIAAAMPKKEKKELLAQMQRVKKYSKTAKQRRAEAAGSMMPDGQSMPADAATASCSAATETPAAVKVNQFNRLRPVDKLMADFAGWQVGSEHSRNEINNAINAYIKREELQSIPSNKRLIVPDAALRDLLNYHDEPTITYPHIQKYIGARFTA
jgi:chromatin remodeling complex protein RSC6